MYEYIRGKIVAIKEEYIVLDNNDIGYKIFTSGNSISKLQLNEICTMYIYFNLREDGIYLYGFIDEEELEIFNLLLLVSKIGPKTALGTLSALTPNQIKNAIVNNDLNTLCTAPGIGKKTAGRIVLELKDKLKDHVVVENVNIEDTNEINTAIHGLMSLGYTRSEIIQVINKINTEDLNAEDIIRESLKRLSKN
ncbi:MAG: Holliday junction branch migration protein RuvA [Tissierellia bacterium]|nr:Holliday junction branch migration protein RuvA [Tissierellia bacterium]